MSNVVDAAVENKLLTVAGRIGMTITLLLLPLGFGWLAGVSNDLEAIRLRMSIAETTLASSNAASVSGLSTVSDQVEELRRQNVLILQAIARLETSLESKQ
jgi:hypothetical protein